MKKVSELKAKIKAVKIILTDVDGVLTDGGLYYTSEGLLMKRFQVKDGMGTVLLKAKGYKVGIVSSDNSPLIETRGEKLKLDFVYSNALDKKQTLDEICAKENLQYKNIAFIGDDVNDIEIMKLAGLSACPKDAVSEITQIADYVCGKKGGEGAFREFAELILRNSNL